MAKWSKEQKETHFYSLYLLLSEEARMNFTKIGKTLGINSKTAAKLYRLALEEEVLLPPALRLKWFPNFQTYYYFLKFKDPSLICEKLLRNPRINYISMCCGSFDLMIVSDEKIDFSMEEGFENIVLSGPRGDYIFNKVERKSMDRYISEFQNFLSEGDFVLSEIMPPVREELCWDDLDLALFNVLREDVRMKYADVINCLGLSKSTFYEHLGNVMENCTIVTQYYPKGYSNYDGYFILFRTEYENQLVEMLKKMPVCCFFSKVKNWIFSCIMVDKDILQRTFLDLLRLMQFSGFVEEYQYSISLSFWIRW